MWESFKERFFATRFEKIFVISVLVLVISIPTFAFLVAKRYSVKNQINTVTDNIADIPATNPLDDIKNNGIFGINSGENNNTANPTAQAFYGPILNFKLILQGRPQNNQTSQVFVGLASGQPQTNPQFLLSYLVDIPANGVYTNLSLSGLTQGQTYTAYIKGPAQIATASAFIVNPTINDIGTQNLISGDLNEDNIINDLDYDLMRASYGAVPTSSNWNANYDLNKDNIINYLDMGFVVQNINMVGASGPWYSRIGLIPSPPPNSTNQPTGIGSTFGDLLKQASNSAQASSSAQITIKEMTEQDKPKGYWMWVPASY